MVQTFARADQLQPGQLVFITTALAEFVGKPAVARKATTVIEATTAAPVLGVSVVSVTLAAVGPVLFGTLELVEVLDTEEQRPLGELEAMGADDLTCHALAYCATRRWDEYAALVVGLLAMVLDEDEADVAERILAAAAELVAA